VAPELDQEFDPGTLHVLRAKVLVQACRAGLSESRAADVVLAVHELAANAIRHGAGAGRLRVWNLVRELCCQVDDGDPPQSDDRGWNSAGSATSAADGHRQTLASSMSGNPGHGLWLVRQVADRMGMASGPGCQQGRALTGGECRRASGLRRRVRSRARR
jgi:anti-sigma regulatory factor (Ser/Thr protein kinase)